MENKTDTAVEKALIAKANHFNCAQSVLLGWKDEYSVPDQQVTDAKACGGGHAPEGLCGALWAALSLVPDEAKQEKVKSGFLEKAKSLYCKDIRGKNIIPCSECVAVAARLVGDVDRK